jgi:hypothetical protein
MSSPRRSRPATWRKPKVVGPYDAGEIRSLRNEVDGDLYTSGSRTPVRAMLADGLVDEYPKILDGSSMAAFSFSPDRAERYPDQVLC